jgi:hypothetical protein
MTENEVDSKEKGDYEEMLKIETDLQERIEKFKVRRL